MKKSGTFPNIQSDGELEFLRDYFAGKQMYLTVKATGHHSNLIENYIRQVKRKIFLLANVGKRKNWSSYLNSIIHSINEIPKAVIGYLKPADVAQGEDGTKQIKEKLRELNLKAGSMNTIPEQEALFKQFSKKRANHWLMPGSPVYLTILQRQSAILKEKSPKRGALYYIRKV